MHPAKNKTARFIRPSGYSNLAILHAPSIDGGMTPCCLKAHDLITSPAFIVMKAAGEFKGFKPRRSGRRFDLGVQCHAERPHHAQKRGQARIAVFAEGFV